MRDEERREVARRLREQVPCTYEGMYCAVMGRQVAPDSRWGDDARELCERLAGLIEPRVEDRPGKFRVGERAYVAVDYPCGSMLVAGDEVEVVDVTKHSALVHQHGGQCWHVTRGQLTHERPDSWERLEEDAGKEACEYFAHMPCGCETPEMLDETVEKCNAAKARDLVRRCRALAERDAK